ncbi:hypothetical protein FQZ97_1055380 [compost metagenome]
MQAIGIVWSAHPSVLPQRLLERRFFLKRQFRSTHQAVQSRQDRSLFKAVARPEHPFQLQHDGERNVQTFIALGARRQQACNGLSLHLVVNDQPAHQNVGVQGCHQALPKLMSSVATLRPAAGVSRPRNSRTDLFLALSTTVPSGIGVNVSRS